MQFLVSAKWIEGEAKERGIDRDRRRGRAPVRADQEPVVPEREGLPALPEDVRPDRGGPRLPRPARRALEQDPPAGHRGAAQNVSDSEIEDYYNENEQQFSQPERRDLEVILTKKQAKALEAKQARRGRREVVDGRQGPLGRPRLQGAGRQAARRHQGPAGPEARRRDLRRRAEARSPGRSRPTPATTSSGSPRSRRPRSRASSSPSRASSSCSSRRSSRRSSTVLHQLPQRLARAHRLRQGLRDRRLPQRP